MVFWLSSGGCGGGSQNSARKAGVIEAVLVALQIHKTDPSVLEHGLMALANLMVNNPANKVNYACARVCVC